MTGKDAGFYIDDAALEAFAYNSPCSAAQDGETDGRAASRVVLSALSNVRNECTRMAELVSGSTSIPAAAEWLLDNFYLAEREGRAAASDIREIGVLPACAGEAIILKSALILTEAGLGEINEARMEMFLNGWQRRNPFSERELAAFMPAVKAALVIYLARVCPKSETVCEDAETSSDAEMLLKNVFTSLRFLADFDASELLRRQSVTEEILSKDPAGVYTLMDEKTRAMYRREIAVMAKKARITEADAAKYVLELASKGENSHVGHYILREPFGTPQKISRGGWYITAIVLASLFFSILVGMLLDSAVSALLLVLPVSQIVKDMTDFISLKLVRPRLIPSLDLEAGVPYSGRTLCIVSALVTSEESIRTSAKSLERYMLANRPCGNNLMFGVLADLPEARREIRPEDEKNLRAAAQEIAALNEKYGGGFYLFARGRTYNEADGVYMGWERKRGAILELVRLLSGRKSRLVCLSGGKAPEAVRFIIALDGDTRLNAGSAAELIGAAMHPLNRPVIDPKTRTVIAGSGIIQPRISVDLDSANRSDFTRIFAGQGGIDPYGSASSDVYQDLFARGSFCGKGIIDIAAYAECIDGRFPENTVLSHDLLEGAYLGCAYMGETELSDGWPYKVMSYYARLHRWVRGDWQTSPWLFGKVKNAEGTLEKNPLCEVDRFKIFDNLRRSMVPVFTFLALVTGMLTDASAFIWTAAISSASVMMNLLLSSADVVFRRTKSTHTRYHSTIISGFSAWLIQTFVRLMLLPYEAYICLIAAVTALWRMNVSKKNMLSWVTAADAERGSRNTAAENYKKMWILPFAGLAVILLAPFPASAAVGVVWILTPAYASSLGREIKSDRTLSKIDRLFLVSAASDIWRFFADMLTEEDNYLPPDNFQERPDIGRAHRTSPTNIGLALLSVLAATDLRLIPRERALWLIGKTLETVERLEKWRGHLYNWYDTETLRPLEPRYVSSVDSGNFAACLITLRGEPFVREAYGDRIDALLEETEIAALYDERRRLFRIGFDAGKNEMTEGWYDLLASEARILSYVAVARGEVPRRHWRCLGRALRTQEGYMGMASWTGTMFEYLMPCLFMPLYRNSLLYESAKFCVYVQRKRAVGGVWGISESAFYAFDKSLSYRYKAHGVQRLALRRGMDSELVISPYSSFLALTVEPGTAIKNLKKLKQMGAEGKYGFVEAVDMTPSRTDGEKYALVRTFMAHHLGMSLIAAAGVLCGEAMQKRFMADSEMCAFKELLQEKVPTGGVVLRRVPSSVPEKPRLPDTESFRLTSEAVNLASPRAALLSNGVYDLMVSETGQSRSTWRGAELTHFTPMPYSENCGMYFLLRTDSGDMPLAPSPFFDKTVRYSSETGGHFAVNSAEKDGISASVEAFVPAREIGEQRAVKLTNMSDKPIEGHLICCFEPIMCAAAEFEAHPEFSRLFTEIRRGVRSVTVKKRGGDGRSDIYVSLCVSRPASFGVSRRETFGRGNVPLAAPKYAEDDRFIPASDPFITAWCPVSVPPGETAEVVFALSPAFDEHIARDSAERILESGIRPSHRHAETAAVLDLDTRAVRLAMETASELIYLRRPAASGADFAGGIRALWRFGISGDLPIRLVDVRSDAELDDAAEEIRRHAFLSENGLSHDLVLMTSDSGDYRQNQRRTVGDVLRSMGRESELGAFGGVFVVSDGAEGADTVRAMASSCASEIRRRREDVPSERKRRRGGGKTEVSFGENGEVIFSGALPERVWSNILANDEYGFIASDAGTGHMWHRNSRENKINTWTGDAYASVGPETLELVLGEKKTSLFASGEGGWQTVFGQGWARWMRSGDGWTSCVTAFVPPDVPARVFIIELEGVTNGRVRYGTDLLLGNDEKLARCVETSFDGEIFTAINAANAEFCDTVFSVAASETPIDFTGDRLSFMSGTLDSFTGTGVPACAGLEYPAAKKLVIVTGCGETAALRALCTPTEAEKAFERTKEYWRRLSSPITVDTGDAAFDRYVSHWALYQVLSCRMKARTSVYQCGGAFGFRDQLQDAAALVWSDSTMLKQQLLRASSHQFEEGDVCHWWHETSCGVHRGVRTRCSDDLLWLPWAMCEYILRTGDTAFAAAVTGYLSAPELGSGERERYFELTPGDENGTMLDHAVRACRLVMKRGTGSRGLLKILGGDWNDGMNLVGAEGRGESVWLTFFASVVFRRMSKLFDLLGDERAEEFACFADSCLEAGERAWDGRWFIRGTYDDGTLLGSESSEECSIDSVAQSFSVFAGAREQLSLAAVEHARDVLFDRKTGLVRLFKPPFGDGEARPGYIKRYGAGFRENGGQYTHAAVWLSMALFEAGRPDGGWEILRALLPENHDPSVYLAEPYVIAADVWDAEGVRGRAGWTWYTGAAGWYFRAAVESMLGMSLEGGKLRVSPNLPNSSDTCSVTVFGHEVCIKRIGEGYDVTLDGKRYKGDAVWEELR